MTVSGYCGEFVTTDDFTPRWICQLVSRTIFYHIFFELLVVVATATSQETDPVIENEIQTTKVMTIIRWCTYLVVSLSTAARVRGYKDVSGAPDLVSALNQQPVSEAIETESSLSFQQPVSEAIETDQVVSLCSVMNMFCTNWLCRKTLVAFLFLIVLLLWLA